MVTPSLPGLRIRNCPVVNNSCETVFGSIDVQRPVEGLRTCISLPLLTLLIKPSRISAATVCIAKDGLRLGVIGSPSRVRKFFGIGYALPVLRL